MSNQAAQRENIARNAATGLWRYRDVLPPVEPVTLGEGWTPLLRSRRHPGLYLKQEAHNPTGTTAARGIATAVSLARDLGLRHLALAADADSAVALAAYAAAAELSAHIYLAADSAFAAITEATAYGADLHLLENPVQALAAQLHAQREAQVAAEEAWLDLSSPSHPSRLEGDKTLTFELCEQLAWQYPEAILYPAAAGPLALERAFEEFEQLGWVAQGSKRPTLYPVQATNFTEEALLDYAKQEGWLLSPAGAAAAALYASLLVTRELQPTTRAVLINPTSAHKFNDQTARAMHLHPRDTLPKSMPVGGIITPV